MTQAQARILSMVRRGVSFTRIEEAINVWPNLSQDQRAALWLYAWAHQHSTWQRDEARAMLDTISG